MSKINELIVEIDSVIEKIAEAKKLSRELFEEEVTPYDIIAEVDALDDKLKNLKSQLRSEYEFAGYKESKSFELDNASIDIRVSQSIDFDALVEDYGNIPGLNEFVETKQVRNLKKTANKEAFFSFLRESGVDVDNLITYPPRIYIKPKRR